MGGGEGEVVVVTCVTLPKIILFNPLTREKEAYSTKILQKFSRIFYKNS